MVAETLKQSEPSDKRKRTSTGVPTGRLATTESLASQTEHNGVLCVRTAIAATKKSTGSAISAPPMLWLFSRRVAGVKTSDAGDIRAGCQRIPPAAARRSAA